MPVDTSCDISCIKDLKGTVSASFVWPSDPYPTLGKTSVTLNQNSPELLGNPNTSGVGVGINFRILTRPTSPNPLYPVGSQIPVRIWVSYSLAAQGDRGSEINVNNNVSIPMISQNGIDFTLDTPLPSETFYAGLSYGYSDLSPSSLIGGCSPAVWGNSNPSWVVKNATLTLEPPTDDTRISGYLHGKASFNMTFAGDLTWQTNDAFYCNTSVPNNDPNGQITGHKQTYTGFSTGRIAITNALVLWDG